MEAQSLPDLLAPYRTDAIVTACGVSRNAVAEWRGGRSVPRDAETLSALADLLKVDAKDLLDIVAASARSAA
jgi:transcriptional regulator with XRE-family HTH domain